MKNLVESKNMGYNYKYKSYSPYLCRGDIKQNAKDVIS